MPRPKGWKPFNYRTIATIRGKLCLGQRRSQIASEMGVPEATVGHLREVLSAIGALPKSSAHSLPEELDREICRLVRTTMLSNQQIPRRLGLTWTGGVRARRKAFHDELRAKRELVPLCRCGDEYQHVHRCPFKGISPKPLDPRGADDAIKDLQAGVPLQDLMRRFSISARAAIQLRRFLTPKQRRKRRKCIAARGVATRRRNQDGFNFDGLYERLDAAVSKSLPPEVRSEVLQEMALQMRDGRAAGNQTGPLLQL